ncbi:hypothetical protein HMPREF1486_04160 [Streptomyces sp. HPH0547]|nr:hypothetical protein HMPREF1486_04160 [Streptomyces sp. HPH0547]
MRTGDLTDDGSEDVPTGPRQPRPDPAAGALRAG